jgi:hypothetical protein
MAGLTKASNEVLLAVTRIAGKSNRESDRPEFWRRMLIRNADPKVVLVFPMNIDKESMSPFVLDSLISERYLTEFVSKK